MLKEALEKAKEFLNDSSLCITKYAETDNYYLFEYCTKEGKAVFDNTLIKVTKGNRKIATNYVITEHLEELEKIKFKEIDTK